MSEKQPKKHFEKTGKVIGIAISVMTIWGYYEIFIKQGINPIIEDWVSVYRSVVDCALGPFDIWLRDLANAYGEYFHLKVELQPYWRYLFVPALLYFGALATNAKADGRVLYRWALALLGLIVALFYSVFVATQGIELRTAPALVGLVTAVIFYELAAYSLLLLLVRKEKRTSAPGCSRYLVEKPVTTLAVGMLSTTVLGLGLSDKETEAALALVWFIFLLGLRDIALAMYFTWRNRTKWPGTFKDRFLRSKSWLLGFYVVGTIALATYSALS